jgi:DNA-binding response OmpR family regulator
MAYGIGLPCNKLHLSGSFLLACFYIVPVVESKWVIIAENTIASNLSDIIANNEKSIISINFGGVRMEKLKILVVDDESRMRKLVKDFLVRENYEVIEAENGEQAIDIFFSDKNIALIILDVMMPKMDGWQVCREIRQYSKVPIIMLTAKGDEKDELYGFELGVDEYISKPFSPKILVARVEAVLRRTMGADEEPIEVGGIILDKVAHIVKIDGERIDLSFKEFELLSYFIENKGVALSRERILNNVWNYDYFGDARTIDTHVKKLRSKMGIRGDYIKTIWGLGYKFEVDS